MSGSEVHFQTRKFIPQCHICQFVKKYPQGGELLEAWLLTGNRPIVEILRYFNEESEWSKKHPEFSYEKISNHRNHMPAMQQLVVDARDKVLAGRVSLETVAIDLLATYQGLIDQGVAKLARGELEIGSAGELIRALEGLKKLFTDTVQVNVGEGSSGGGEFNEEMLVAWTEVVEEFVPPHMRQKFRERLDEKVFPIWAKQEQSRMQLEAAVEDVEDVEVLDGSGEEE